MSIDYAHTPSSLLYHQETHEFRQLHPLTKAWGAYLQTLADPIHGWWHLTDKSFTQDVRTRTTGPITRGDRVVIDRAMNDLLRVGHLARCIVLDIPPGSYRTADGRTLPLSSWRKDPDGPSLVIVDWVPRQQRLTAAETKAWQAERRKHVDEPEADDVAIDHSAPAPKVLEALG